MIRVTSFVHLRPDASPQALDDVVAIVRRGADEIEALSLQVAPTLPPAHRGGQLMILAAFRDLDQYEAALRHPFVTSALRPALDACADQVETVRYEQGAVCLQQPGLTNGVQRTLLVHVHPTADSAEVVKWERALADMARYIQTIRDSSVSRVDEVDNPSGQPWTHVWEQEYETLDGLTGAYMQHAYHWAWVDRWFDPQQPVHIVDTTLVHAMCDLDRSILSLAG
jgi:hypothetical protein